MSITQKKALELSLILKAYSEGKTIQRQTYSGWIDLVKLKGEDIKQATIKIGGSYLELRIKPEKKLVPFTFEDRDMFKDKWLAKKGCSQLLRIERISSEWVVAGDRGYSFSDMLDKLEFEDGSPCGKYVEE